MPGGSPTAYLLWSILSTLFFSCQLVHLWSYDKFQCLRWTQSGRQPGAFKRFMSYTYLTTLICLVCFSVAFTFFKFQEGYVPMPNGQLTPVPLDYYSPPNRKWIFPLLLVFSVAWGCELVTHLEEFAFWLFLQNQGPIPKLWFKSSEFKLWFTGTILGLVGMPLTTFLTRRQLDSCFAWTLLVGSSASAVTSLAFLFVLSRFPAFIRRVTDDGAAPDVVLRLVFFHQLNIGRIIYRFLYSIPLFILSLDGVQGTHLINYSTFWSDLLLMTGAFGSFVSSAITTLIFFPRSLTQELGYTVVVMKAPTLVSNPSQHPASPKDQVISIFRPPSAQPSMDSSYAPSSVYEDPPDVTHPNALGANFHMQAWNTRDVEALPAGSCVFDQQTSGLVRSRSEGHATTLHPYVRVFRSPIDLCDADAFDNIPDRWRRLMTPRA